MRLNIAAYNGDSFLWNPVGVFWVLAHIIGGVHGKIGFIFVALIVWHSISCAGFFRLAIAK
ncbi:hypothetical protein [Bacteroides congonensis]|uniref:hypothetical protein n=1 Tax=Bacteroides congonensis TaxID=1871006 RepID=UPI00265E0E17|nr:hypothetical protein [Bacteroides congonensis]